MQVMERRRGGPDDYHHEHEHDEPESPRTATNSNSSSYPFTFDFSRRSNQGSYIEPEVSPLVPTRAGTRPPSPF